MFDLRDLIVMATSVGIPTLIRCWSVMWPLDLCCYVTDTTDVNTNNRRAISNGSIQKYAATHKKMMIVATF